jgi:hypothetical protein
MIACFFLAVVSSAPLADVSIGQFADKRATLPDDNTSQLTPAIFADVSIWMSA